MQTVVKFTICLLILLNFSVLRCDASVFIDVNGKTDNGEQQSEKDPTTSTFGIDEELGNEEEKTEKDVTTPSFGGIGDNIIIRIEKIENDGISSDAANVEIASTSDQNEFDNTTIPPLICWEMTCPDCTKLESDFHCFLRSFLTVVVRTVLFLVAIFLLYACFKIVNHKGKKVDSKVNCEEVHHELIEHCKK